jgi:hypothetical protein
MQPAHKQHSSKKVKVTQLLHKFLNFNEKWKLITMLTTACHWS